MAIELQISTDNADQNAGSGRFVFDENEVTIGAYNDDDVKLDRALLQGCHIRLSRQWQEDQSQYRLLLSNISCSGEVIVRNTRLLSDDKWEIHTTDIVKLGEYRISACLLPAHFDGDLSRQIHNQSGSRPAKGFSLESFAPDKLSLSPAIKTEQGPDQSVSEQGSSNANPDAANSASNNKASGNIVKLATKSTAGIRHNKTDTPSGGNRHVLFDRSVGQNDLLELKFDAVKLLSIRGRVLYRGKPLTGLILDGGSMGSTKTNESGEFSFDNITEGTEFRLKIESEEYSIQDGELNGVLNESMDMDLTTLKLIKVSGRLMHKGKPLSGIRLRAGQFGSSVSDGQGYFEFANIPENTQLKIQAENCGYVFRLRSAASPQQASPAPRDPIDPVPADNEKEPEEPVSSHLEESLAILMGNQRR